MNITIRRSVTSAVVAALAVAGMSVSASAENETPKERKTIVKAQPQAAGVIVKSVGRTPSAALLKSTGKSLGSGASVSGVTAMSRNVNAVAFDQAVSVAEAVSTAKELERRDDVVWAVPNFIRQASANPVVTPSDTHFSKQYNLWDRRSASSPEVLDVFGGAAFPRGGFSVKVPDLWQVTKGAPEVVVAVLDTGFISHPDLDGQWVAGYDMISSPAMAGDGNGRDASAKDAGDWLTASQCGFEHDAVNSSWHGAHVSGIVAGKASNGGIIGIAPRTKMLPVRVLGKCGGTDADIIAGIVWAAGGTVPGVAVNANPAKVINLSLGAESVCTTPYANAISFARSQGAVVVSAAGNGNPVARDYDADKMSPANCPGVMSVTATDEYGLGASYANVGSTVDIAAPGGDFSWEQGRAVLSSVNAGTKTPVTGATWRSYEGTSMAAPAVSAAAALLFSLGLDDSQVESGLRHAVQPFTSQVDDSWNGALDEYMCNTSVCGSGILDLSGVPAPITAPVVSGFTGEPQLGQVLTASQGTWLPGKSPVYSYQWYRNGDVIEGAQATTYPVVDADLGATLSVKVTATQAGFPPFTKASAATPVVRKPSTIEIAPLVTEGRHGVDFSTNVTVTSDGESPSGTVQILKGSTVLASGAITGGAGTVVVPGVKLPAGTYGMTAKFVGEGAVGTSTSSPATVTVAKASSSIAHTFVDSTITKSIYPKSKVTIKVAGVAGPTGLVRVYDGSRLLKTFSMYSSYKGVRTFTLPKITKTGRHSIKWVYAGTGNITGRTSTVKYLYIR